MAALPTYRFLIAAANKNCIVLRLRKRFFIYAEDDPDAVFLVRAALRRLSAEDVMIHWPDGEQLMTCLLGHVDRGEVPQSVLLDGAVGSGG